ncbi:MAG: UDP-3-O-(3-hydroxymyristoyl)glucosamine N-acyltransferase [candidate division WOR-3 bacterium]|nr:UDP-3-O-(3-hydroxymyristoyl)glucosamine N-acyltransferase [candidate division WOR-3 bacterium]MDW8150760.1 UDP-3-O-(3-hydroxymyristoyl)glucosamine N-acyltransferase [candidate division WOR-3 bacterium]
MKVSEISKYVNKQFEGEDIDISYVRDIKDADEKSLVFLFDKKNDIEKSVGLVISTIKPERLKYKSIIIVEDIKLAMIDILKLFDWHKSSNKGYISEKAKVEENVEIGENTTIMDFSYISSNSKIGKNCLIYPFVFIGENVKIGDNCIIYPHVYIGENCIVGNNVILHSGVKIGADGFGYYKNRKVPQIGNVIIEDSVEIGANTCIDRATISSTIIMEGTKIDNLVQIAHNVIIGKNCYIASQTGIAGSSKIGNNVIIAGQVGIADHTIVEDNVILLAKTGVNGTLKANNIYGSALPPFERNQYLRLINIIKKLPEIYEVFKRLISSNREESK